MADQWYYGHDKPENGPCTEEQLRHLALLGGVLTSDTIWHEGTETEASTIRVESLFHRTAAEPTAVAAAVALASTPTKVDPPITPVDIKAEKPAAPSAPPAEATVAANGEVKAEEKSTKKKDEPAADKKKEKMGRATAIRGAVIIGQDGELVRYKKQCTRCTHIDASATKVPIKTGVIRGTYFCPKCRKSGEVVIQCVR